MKAIIVYAIYERNIILSMVCLFCLERELKATAQSSPMLMIETVLDTERTVLKHPKGK